MAKKLDLRLKWFPHFLVLNETAQRRYGNVAWCCLCDCGNEFLAASSQINREVVKSCGCRRGPGENHGHYGSPLYRCWNSIQQRCENPNTVGYKDYGGRGIRMCKRWRDSFAAFYHDCKDLYRPGCWIERVDNNGHYEPGNVCWVKQHIPQMNNQRTTAFIDTPKGRMSVAQAARWFGINVNTLRKRYLKGDRGVHLLRPPDLRYSNR